ncbi:hypothetical protein U9M48_028878 [Paspalum notatum var. saurae]|uniref:Phospholipid/glycerol acyltransferase domain-containing protein n=1 Tax=Paspalum notatum var. saurae TaxID=547442 RepID=A0AAQ3TXL3_PASNO
MVSNKKPNSSAAIPIRSFFSLGRLLRRSLSSGRHYYNRRRSSSAATSSGAAATPWAPAATAQQELMMMKLAGGGSRRRKVVLVVDVEGFLLRSPLSSFPYFMLVAVEAGGFLRGLLLLLLYPVLCLLALLGLHQLRLKAMVMVSLFGLREKEVVRISKAVLPKFFLEDLTMEGLEAVVVAMNNKQQQLAVVDKDDDGEEEEEEEEVEAAVVVAVTMGFPRVMVEGFLKEYLGVQAVVGREVAVAAGRYVGWFLQQAAEEQLLERVLAAAIGRGAASSSFPVVVDKEIIRQLAAMEDQRSSAGGKGGDNDDDGGATTVAAVGLVGASTGVHHVVSRSCKEITCYVVSEADKKAWQPLARDKYPTRLVFHDGRLAFRPTFFAAVAMYTYLPWGFFLAVFRSLAFGILPYRVSIPLAAVTGMRSRLIAGPPPPPSSSLAGDRHQPGRLYVCNHRTLLDPITVAAGLNKPVTAVTYSVSPVSELIAPIPTARLTRDRDEDRRRMEALLARGDLVVCPEGTTCREPYLLRFSPLFAELTDEVTPVALDTSVDMFYGTSTMPGAKWMDPFYFMMNSRPEYRVEFLEPVSVAAAATTTTGSSIQAANRVQRVLGEALGFQLTNLTRKHKYMMLAGNQGDVV